MRPIRGVVGRIDWGYFPAAAINGYGVQPLADGGWTLHATVINLDAFKIRQRPLIFAAPWRVEAKDGRPAESGEWRWPIKTMDIGEGHGPRELQATLGPQLPELITHRRGTSQGKPLS